ncbi:MAG: HYExAFE family protein [Planctomycetia bacterium]|nr:HYExAFE family protein [Planctomycetia bacterium]
MPACPLSHKAFATYLLAKGIVSEKVTEIGSAKPGSLLPDVWIPREKGAWLIKIVGRKFPSGQKSPQYWRNWIKEEVLEHALQWENWPGGNFTSLLVFAYEIIGDKSPLEPKQLFSYQGNTFAFVVIRTKIYRQFCKQLSPRWGTVTMPVSEFRKWGRGWEDFWKEAPFI